MATNTLKNDFAHDNINNNTLKPGNLPATNVGHQASINLSLLKVPRAEVKTKNVVSTSCSSAILDTIYDKIVDPQLEKEAVDIIHRSVEMEAELLHEASSIIKPTINAVIATATDPDTDDFSDLTTYPGYDEDNHDTGIGLSQILDDKPEAIKVGQAELDADIDDHTNRCLDINSGLTTPEPECDGWGDFVSCFDEQIRAEDEKLLMAGHNRPEYVEDDSDLESDEPINDSKYEPFVRDYTMHYQKYHPLESSGVTPNEKWLTEDGFKIVTKKDKRCLKESQIRERSIPILQHAYRVAIKNQRLQYLLRDDTMENRARNTTIRNEEISTVTPETDERINLEDGTAGDVKRENNSRKKKKNQIGENDIAVTQVNKSKGNGIRQQHSNGTVITEEQAAKKRQERADRFKKLENDRKNRSKRIVEEIKELMNAILALITAEAINRSNRKKFGMLLNKCYIKLIYGRISSDALNTVYDVKNIFENRCVLRAQIASGLVSANCTIDKIKNMIELNELDKFFLFCKDAGMSWEYALAEPGDHSAYSARFTNLRVVDIVANVWALSGKKRNALVHMLNGNTSLGFLDGDVIAQKGGIPLLPGVTRNDEMCTNTSKKNFIFNRYSLTTVMVGTGIPALTNFSMMYSIILSIDGSAPTSIFGLSGMIYNSANFKYIIVDGAQSTNAYTQVNRTFNNRPIIMPPGSKLWYQSTCPITGALGGTVDFYLAMLDGNFDPTGNIVQLTLTKKAVGLFVKGLNGCKYVKAKTFSEIVHNLGVSQLDKSKYRIVTMGGKEVNEETDIDTLKDLTVVLKLKLPGGMDVQINSIDNSAPLYGTVGESNTKIRIEEEHVKKRISENKTSSAEARSIARKEIKDPHLLKLAERFVKIATTDCADNYLSTQQLNRETLLSTQATTLQTIPVQDNNSGDNLGHTRYRESFFAQVFIEGATDIGIATSHRNVIPALTYTEKWTESVEFSKAFSTLYAALGVGDLVVGSQTLRLRASMANGDAMQRALYALGPQLSTGLVGSYCIVLLKIYAMILGEYPTPGLEQSAWLANSNLVIDQNSRSVGANYLPESSNTLVRPVLNARIIDIDTYTGVLAGTYSNPIPAGFTMDTWGNLTAVVPIRADQQNLPETASAWTMAHIEFPWRRRTYSSIIIDDNFLPNGLSPQTISPVVDHTLLPGPRNNVLFVMCNIFLTTAGTDVAFNIGSNNNFITMTMQANGFQGVSIDIAPALDNAILSDNTFPLHCFVATDWWRKAYGSAGDAIAANILAADISRTCGFNGWCIDSDLDHMYYTSNTPQTVPWNTAGYVDTTTLDTVGVNKLVNTIGTSFTTPWCFTDKFSQNLAILSPTRYVMQPDYSIGPLLTWGAVTFNDKAISGMHIPASIPGLLSRTRELARNMACSADYLLMNTGLAGFELFDPNKRNTFDLNGTGFLPAVASVNGYTEVTLAWTKFYEGINLMINMCGDIPLMYRKFSVLNNDISWFNCRLPPSVSIFSFPQISPCRNPAWYIMAECEKVDLLPQSYSLKRVDIHSKVTSRLTLAPPSRNEEVFDKMIMRPFDSVYAKFCPLFAITWVTGRTPTSARLFQRMRTTQEGLINETPLIMRLNHPSQSISAYAALGLYSPPVLAITAIKDLPTFLPPPLRSASLASYLTIAILSDSQWYRKITVNDLTEFRCRLITPNQLTIMTQEIVNEGENPDLQYSNLGF